MIPSSKLALNRTSREIIKEITRQISKTSTATNSDAITRQENKINLDLNITRDRHAGNNKWNKLSRLNSIRALSTIQTKEKRATSTPMFSKEESREFMAVFPDIVRDLTDAGRHTDIPEVTKRFVKVLQYNVPTGKKVRGLSTVVAYKMLEKPENLTPENIKLANILGWCVELLRGFNTVVDDMIDNSEIRRQMPCWYKQSDVGLKAIPDSSVLQYSVYSILRKYFSHLPCYVPLVEMFHEITTKNSLGKVLDGVISANGNPDLKKFTMKNYNLILKYRAGHYSYQLPVGSAMYLANMFDTEQHRQAKTIVMELGEVFQIQKDFMNVFGSQELVGKIGSDIEEGKCSWLAVVALQRMNPAQKKLMEKHYGKSGEESIETVRELYIQLGLPATYSAYEDESYKIINTHVQQISKGLPHELFLTLLVNQFKN